MTPMYPVLRLPIPPHELPTYGVVLAAYFAVALCMLLRIADRDDIPARVVLAVFALGVPSGIVGARLLDMFEYADRYSSVSAMLGRNGSSIYGALIANAATTTMYLRWRGVPVLRFFDAVAPLVMLGEAFSRVGCFLNGCCYGVSYHGPFAVSFPRGSFAFHDQVARGLVAPSASQSLDVHPVQLYSCILALLAFIILHARARHRRFDGEITCATLVSYGALRLAMAPLRVEALLSMRFLSIGAIAAGSLGWWATRRAWAAGRMLTQRAA